MENNFVPIYRSTRANSTRIVSTKDNSEHLLRATTASFKTVVNRDVASQDRQIDEQKPAENPTGSWAGSTEKMAYMPKNTDIYDAVKENEDQLLQGPSGDSLTSLKSENIVAMKIEVH